MLTHLFILDIIFIKRIYFSMLFFRKDRNNPSHIKARWVYLFKKMLCTFFGHADAPKEIEPTLRKLIINLIETENVKTFYVGNNGNFDVIVQNILHQLSDLYQIQCYLILAYLPKHTDEYILPTLFPEGLEFKPPKFAIDYRNQWMINNADYVITFVNRTVGGSVKFKAIAEKKGKIVINITI